MVESQYPHSGGAVQPGEGPNPGPAETLNQR